MLDEAIVNEDGTIQIKMWKKNIIIVSPLVNTNGLFLPSLTITLKLYMVISKSAKLY